MYVVLVNYDLFVATTSISRSTGPISQKVLIEVGNAYVHS